MLYHNDTKYPLGIWECCTHFLLQKSSWNMFSSPISTGGKENNETTNDEKSTVYESGSDGKYVQNIQTWKEVLLGMGFIQVFIINF